MPGMWRAGISAAMLMLAAITSACDIGRPHALDRIDKDFALGWDTTAWVGRRGNCFSAREGMRPSTGWQMSYGRYIVTLVDTTVKPKRTIRGRMYLAMSSANDTSLSGARLAESDTRRHPLIGATDFPLESLGIPLDSAAPPRNSFDPLRPGVLVVHLNSAAPENAPDFAIWLGTPATQRIGAPADSTGGIVLAVRAAVGDGFWGMWGSRGVGRVRRGYFCAGWIDA